ncbi:MAG: hypothetical protein IT198_08835 [Acidimicrobiia bacterium]|nr:hypothetical protein [Acidimicrobiia bacterium]
MSAETDIRIWLATDAGLHVVDPSGQAIAEYFGGREVTSVDANHGWVAAAVTESGVQRRRWSGDVWESLGLASSRIWAVAVGADGAVYAGLEPAALHRLGRGPAADFDLTAVPGHDFWHSPWGPANLSSIVVDGSRIVVGVEVGGVVVSHDAGATWSDRNDGLYEDVHHLITDGDRFHATTGMGFHTSKDEGLSWVWANEGVDRGYTQGLTRCGSRLVMASSSGPPPMWESGGPEAALLVAETSDDPLQWRVAVEGFGGNVERQALQSDADLVVAATRAGELLVSSDAAETFDLVRTDLPPVTSVALDRVEDDD